MTSIVKKVLRSSGKKKKNHHGSEKGRRTSIPESPPSPDLTGLNPDELAILKDVLKRQEEFESEEVDRQHRLRENLFTYEDEVKKHASQKSKLKNVDLRLCRLCYKTKFADGIGKACYDCHKRVCNKCGSFSQATWNAKKNKTVKGKWRCNMCQMKRDVVAKTGVWYHGDEQPEISSHKFKTKLSTSEMDSNSENDGPLHISTTDPTAEDDDKFESDVFSEESIASSRVKAAKRAQKACLRRRSTSQSEMEDVDDDDDEIDAEFNQEQFQKERQICRMQRHSKRSRRRLRSGSLSEWSGKDGYTDAEKKMDASSSDAFLQENSSTDYYQSTDQDRYTHSDRSPDRKEKSARGPKRTPTSMSLQENLRGREDGAGQHPHRGVIRQKRSLDENYPCQPRSGFREDSRSNRHDYRDSASTYEKRAGSRSQSVESNKSRRQKHSVLREQQSNDIMPIIEISKNQKENVPSITSSRESLSKRKRQSEIHANVREQRVARESRTSNESRMSRDSVSSQDSRVLRESRFSRGSCTSYDSIDMSPVPVGMRRKLERQNETCYSSSSSIFSDSKPYQTHERARFELSDTSPSKAGSVQDDFEKQYFAQKLPRNMNKGLTANRLSSNSLSPDMAFHRSQREKNKSRRNETLLQRAGSASPKMSSDLECSGSHGNDVIRDTYNRRMTLPHCINIDIPQRKRPENLSPSRAHQIIIHRNKRDNSVRTQGLGMRVVGGRRVSGGRLCAYVTMVIKGGPADRQGISEGDQVVEWNGRSLLDVTFEEAQEIISQSGSIVQLSIIHGALNTGSNQSLRRNHPIIIKSEVLPLDTLPPDTLFLGRPKRRMLPKTPVEIKRDVRKINGRLWLQLDYDHKCNCLLVVLLRGEDILSETCVEDRQPNTLAMLHLLPSRHTHEAKESDIKLNNKDPNWNETFVFANLYHNEIKSLALEVTVWNYRDPEDEFLGEVLLDLGEAKIDNSVNCYHLEDHDENSSPLPYRKKSFSLSDSAVSPVTSIETSSYYPSRDPSREPSPRSSVSVAGKDVNIRKLSLTPAHEKIKEFLTQGKRSPCRDKHDFSSSAHSSPLNSPTSTEFKMTSSLTSLVKRKIGVVTRLSSTLASVKREAAPSDHHHGTVVRSQSDTDLRESNLLQPCSSPQQPRRSFETNRYELLAPPHPLNISNSSGNNFFDDRDSSKSPNPDRPAPEGDDITSLLGPGQTAPKPTYETNVCGDIKMGFMVSKGQLEIDIVVVKGLMKSGLSSPPDTYVKTYLVEGAKTVQKKKTQTIRMSFDPVFRKTIRYSACNIHGRYIRVNVWDKPKTFDKKQCLGEAVVKLDSLDLSQHTMSWYKLFPLGAAEVGSTESLNFWPIH